MNSIVPCTLRSHRKLWGISQRELARLLGFTSADHIYRLEHGKRDPGLETALACATLFGVSLDELFPQLAFEIEETLRKRISRFREGNLDITNISEVRKRELFSRALSLGGADEARAASV